MPRAERRQERRSSCPELFFESRGAITAIARPRFRAVLVAAIPPVVRVLNPHEVEIFLPVGTFFLQRRRAVAHLDPTGRLVWAQTGVLHVAQVFAFRDGSLA